VDGRTVAWIGQVWRLWSKEFRVEMSRAAGTRDPRLVLASGLEELRRVQLPLSSVLIERNRK
jgi:hypothetical protein